MNVAYLTEFDTNNFNLRSGVPYFISNSIKNIGYSFVEVRLSDNRGIWDRLISRVNQWLYDVLFSRRHGRYDPMYTKAVTKSYLTKTALGAIERCDIVIAINPLLVAWLFVNKPIALYIDNSFETYCMYPGIDNFSSVSRKMALGLEKKAFEKATFIFVASEWLRRKLEFDYPTVSEKIKVMPRGANVFQRPLKEHILQDIHVKVKSEVLRILFVSSNWERKGGDSVLAIFDIIKRKIPIQLTIVGPIPKETNAYVSENNIVCTGLIDRTDDKGKFLYDKILSDSHFLLVPSVADGFGNVYAEAASFGVPSVAYAIMGVTEAVIEGVTGWLLPKSASEKAFADLICQKWEQKKEYYDTCLTAYKYAAAYFDWQVNLGKIIDSLLGFGVTANHEGL